MVQLKFLFCFMRRGCCAAMVTHSPPTAEVGGSNPVPYMGKLVVSYRWSAVYSTES